jgi:hypothetical protein
MKKKISKSFLAGLVLLILVCSNARGEINLTPIEPPAPTAKLRIFVVAVTSSDPKQGVWATSQKKFAVLSALGTNKMLQDKGLYEVVPLRDIKAVLGGQQIASWQWMDKDWALAKNVARALYADYVLLIERSVQVHMQFDMTLVNLNTGNKFTASDYVPSNRVFNGDQMQKTYFQMVRTSYRQIFRDAKKDLIQTAMRKGKIWSEVKEAQLTGKQPPEPIRQQVMIPSKTEIASEPPAAAIVPDRKAGQKAMKKVDKQLALEKESEQEVATKDKKQDGSRLVVYDFNTAERLQIVGLILTEALREELYNTGGFILVNRENMVQVMEELKLQQSGLVDEKQVVKMGKWLAANEAVTGNLAIIGSTSILQVKRFDITTMGTIALGALKCKTGEEDELLSNIGELARKLVQQKNK